MSKFEIRLLTPARYAAALVVDPAVAPAKATTNSSKHIKHKKHWGPGFSDPRSVGQAWPGTRPSSQAGATCPGIARSFECRTWPSPFGDDPDRKHSSLTAARP
jgi:hypothetical protein